MAWVDVQAIRDAIEERGIDHNALARALGWSTMNRHGKPTPDTARVRRRLGILTVQNSREKRVGISPHHQRMMRVDTAVKILDAAGLDPVDAGI